MTVPEEPRTRRSNSRDSSSDVSDSENDSYSSGGSVSDSDAEDADHGDPSEMPITEEPKIEEPKIEEPKVETPDPSLQWCQLRRLFRSRRWRALVPRALSRCLPVGRRLLEEILPDLWFFWVLLFINVTFLLEEL